MIRHLTPRSLGALAPSLPLASSLALAPSLALCLTLLTPFLPLGPIGTEAAAQTSPSLNWEMAHTGDIHKVLPLRERARVYNEILEWRLDNILPAILREEGVDMWVVINFEYDEDPVYMTLVPEPAMSARRLSILAFHDSPDG